jgi:hypothetical protein
MLLSIMHTRKHLPGDPNHWAGASLFLGTFLFGIASPPPHSLLIGAP